MYLCFVWISEQTMVTICTLGLIYKNSTFCPHSVQGGSNMTGTNCDLFTNSPGHIWTTLYLCILCGSQNKQRLFHYTTLTDRFLKPKRSVHCAVRTESLSKNSGFSSLSPRTPGYNPRPIRVRSIIIIIIIIITTYCNWAFTRWQKQNNYKNTDKYTNRTQ